MNVMLRYFAKFGRFRIQLRESNYRDPVLKSGSRPTPNTLQCLVVFRSVTDDDTTFETNTAKYMHMHEYHKNRAEGTVIEVSPVDGLNVKQSMVRKICGTDRFLV